MSDNHKELWANLLNDIAPSLDVGERYCAARSIRGSSHELRGIAVVGRAPNGWAFDFSKEEINRSISGLVARIVDVHVCTADQKMTHPEPKCGPMHWIEHPYYYRGATRINAEFGRFWPAVAAVMNFPERNRRDKWEEEIAWANLYPVSYACGGNPNTKLKRAQRANSANLLAHDLQEWKPSVVLFITEVNRENRFSDSRDLEWSEPFHEALGVTSIKYRKGPVVAVSKISVAGPDARAIFVVRPDARRMSRDGFKDWTREISREIRPV